MERVLDKGHGAHDLETLTSEDRFYEALMMGLRLRNGVSVKQCEALSGLKFDDMMDAAHLQAAYDEGWLVMDGDILKATREGMLRLNALIPYILK